MKKYALTLIALLTANIALAQTREQAQHRLPPVIYSVDIPQTVRGGRSYTYEWSIMGYHNDYDCIIEIKDENGNRLVNHVARSIDSEQGQYRWGDIRSERFFYEVDLTLNIQQDQDLTVRFYARPDDDPIEDQSFLSCIVPGGSGYRAGDTTGRKILIEGKEGDSTADLDPYSRTVITSRYSSSKYATTLNPFVMDAGGQDLRGQCTWYVYGRVIELADQGDLPMSAFTTMQNSFWGVRGRHAKNFDTLMGGTWIDTNHSILPESKRKPGMLVMWDADNNEYGHIAFVEEISDNLRYYRVSDFNIDWNETYDDTRWRDFEGDDSMFGVYPKFYDLNQ